MGNQRQYTTLSGTPKENNSGFSNALDDYGIVSNIQRALQSFLGNKHSDGVHGMIAAMPHPSVTPNAGMGGVDLNSKRRRKSEESIAFEAEKVKKERIDQMYRRLNKTITPIPSKKDIEHTNAMTGNDTDLSYMEKGEKVLPVAVQKQFPELTIAVEDAIKQMGENPGKFEVGSKDGNYNKQTGVQQFAGNWWDDIYKYGTQAVDYMADNPYARSLAAGAATAGVSKLTGASNQTALASGLGAGIGNYGGQYINQALTDPKSKFLELPKTLTYGADKKGSSTGADSLKNLYDQLSGAEFYGTTGGAGIGATLGYSPPDALKAMPGASINTAGMGLSNLSMSNAPTVNFLKGNDSPNYLARPSAALPVAPMYARAEGVSYKNKVKDRDTGAFKYSSVDDEDDTGLFARNVQKAMRRSGFGSSLFG